MTSNLRRLTAGFTTIVVVLVALTVMYALPTSEFELDGNAILNGIGDDWANTVPNEASNALVSTFIADGSGNATIFTGGGSKDGIDLSSWKWKDQLGGLPDKDNITNAYAAAYTNPAGQLTVYFGADRFATSGDAELGFWFFHQRVQTVNGNFVGADGVSPAQHTIGDILVLAHFAGGGSDVTILVYKWIGNLPGGPLQLVGGSATQSALCGSNFDPNVCAITNSVGTAAPWAYTPKAGSAGTFPPVSFFEGGINLSAFISTEAGGCFSSFLAETRSSTSTTATLKDFALGEFNTCDIDISKTCPTVVYDSATNLLNYTSHISVENKGFGTVYDVTVIDTPTDQQPTTLTLASLAKGATHVFQHTFSYTPGMQTPNPPQNTASVTAAVNPGGLKIVDGGSASATCPQVSFDAALSITKSCTSGLEIVNGKMVVVVNVVGEVCNVPPAPGGPFPEGFLSVLVGDSPPFEGGSIDLGSLAVGQCKPYAAKYYPGAFSLVEGQPSSAPGDQLFLDTANVTATGAISGAARANSASANCPLCPPCVGAGCVR